MQSVGSESTHTHRVKEEQNKGERGNQPPHITQERADEEEGEGGNTRMTEAKREREKEEYTQA